MILFIVYFHHNWKKVDLAVWLLLLAKIVSAVVFVYLYIDYYKEGDIVTYQQLANKLVLQLESGVLEWEDFLLNNKGLPMDSMSLNRPREIFFTKLITTIYALSFSNLFCVSILFSIVSWIILFESYKRLKEKEWDHKLMVYAFFFAPSVLFFTSGIFKEAICFPFFILFILIILNWYEGRFIWTEVILALFGVFLFLSLRYFYIPFLLVFTSIYGMIKYARNWRFWIVITVCSISYLTFQSLLIPQLQLSYFSELIYQSYLIMQIKSSPGTSFDLNFQNASLKSTLFAMIESVKATYFILFHNIPVALISIENIIILLGTIVTIVTKPKLSKLTIALLGMIIFMILLLNTTTPNYGTLTRYRVTYWYPMVFLIGLKIKDLFIKKRSFLM